VIRLQKSLRDCIFATRFQLENQNVDKYPPLLLRPARHAEIAFFPESGKVNFTDRPGLELET
jgi:hypothetical protein